ncbi:MAG: peptide deformylase [Chloroflexi bacterium]|nr:peptide deformylase [Chloroflexota bacterium]
MAVLPILTADHAVLRQKGKKIRTSANASLQRLIDDMIDTMRDAYGVGLAAPQVGKSLQVAVIEIPEQEVLVLVNPEIIKRTGQRQVEEGCLSVPGYRGLVWRSETVTIKALNRRGKEIRINRATGLLAQALEHEIDHLNGILYLDHLVAHEKLWKIEPHAVVPETEAAGMPQEPGR